MSNEFKPSMTPELRRRLQNNAARLFQLVANDAPDVVLANEVSLLVRVATAGMGSVLFDQLYADSFLAAREKIGMCSECDDRHVPQEISDRPLCAAHVAEWKEQYAQWDRDLEESHTAGLGHDGTVPRYGSVLEQQATVQPQGYCVCHGSPNPCDGDTADDGPGAK